MNATFKEFGPWAAFAGRILIALIFVVSGYGKIGGYEATQSYMSAMGVPGALLPLVIATELGGGMLIVVGLFTRYVALALAGFSILAAILFHHDFGDQMQRIMFMKNLAIAGGFLILVAHGPGRLSIDHRRRRS